jgi:cytochrome c oxidase subunit II
MNIYAIGHQWWWEFRYPPDALAAVSVPNPGNKIVVTADELHVPTGISLHFHISSNDVIHSFWTPQLQRQIDANPGQDNAVFVKLDNPGTYDGACYEYCGTAHAWMKYRVIVQRPVQFKAWLEGQLADAAKPVGLAAVGQRVFNSNTCVSCHVLTYPGTPAHGVVGPNLTHLAIRWTIGAGAAPLTKSDLMAWIRDPNSYKPGVLMPGFPLLSQSDLDALATYLISLK